MSRRTLSGTLASDVADAGTFTSSYPTGTETGTFFRGVGNKLVVGQNVALTSPHQFSLTFGASSITITNKSGATWPAGAAYILELEKQGKEDYKDNQLGNVAPSATLLRSTVSKTFLINLGAPDTLDTDGICASQNRTGAGAMVIDGALAASGVVTLDVPRNVIAASGGADTAVITVTGTDEYGVAMSEAITLNGATPVNGKKAFKTITAVASSATTSNGFFLGNGDVLGLPVFLGSKGLVLREMQDGDAPTAGTFVAGVQTSGGSTTTTGDVRGTYDPNAACDAAKVFQLLVSVPDPGYLGMPQA
jgi:hypothetical protein